MADIKNKYGSATAITITLASLGDGSGRQSTEIDNSSNKFIDALVRIKAKGLAGSTGNIEVYAFAQVGNDVRTDEAGASDSAITQRNAPLVGIIEMDGTTSVTSAILSIAQAFGGTLPEKWGIIIVNQSGAALSATGGDFDLDYQGVYKDVV